MDFFPLPSFTFLKYHIFQKQYIGVLPLSLDCLCSTNPTRPRSKKWQYFTHLPLDKMAAISPTIFSDAFSWTNSFVFWLKFPWSLFLRVQLTITQHVVSIMAWRRIGDTPLSEPMLTWFTDALGGTREAMSLHGLQSKCGFSKSNASCVYPN